LGFCGKSKSVLSHNFSGRGAQPPRGIAQRWLKPPSPHVVGAYGSGIILFDTCKLFKTQFPTDFYSFNYCQKHRSNNWALGMN